MEISSCELLEWDSAFFGVKIARVTAQRLSAASAAQVLNWCAHEGVACLYFLCDADDDESVLQAEQHGFHFTDIRLELSWRVQEPMRLASRPPMLVREFRETDLAELQKIALDAYVQSRFYFDHQFNRARVAEMYREWLIKCCLSDAVLVAELQQQAVGFAACRMETAQVGRLALIGVSSAARGLGVGHALIAALQDHFRARGVSEVRITTQGRNINAQRLYQAHGFRTSQLRLWYHKWFTAAGGV